MNARRVLLLVVAVNSFALSQISTSSLRGTAVDPNGAAVPGATVVIESSATEVVERTLTTDTSGGYSAEGLPPGIYKVSVRKQGFGEQVRSIELQVGRVETLDFKLAMGTVQQNITVT